jgi:hypothetical protein
MKPEDEIIGFNRQDATELLRKIEGGTLGGVGLGTYDATSIRMAIATSGIPARSGTTLGSATVTAKHLTISGSTRVIADSSNTYTAYNLAATAVNVDSYILTLRLGDVHVVIWEEC